MQKLYLSLNSEEKNVVLLTDSELAELEALQHLKDGSCMVLSAHKTELLKQLANKELKDANSATRHKFYDCDTIGCGMCSRRGVCWSVSLANEILGIKD